MYWFFYENASINQYILCLSSDGTLKWIRKLTDLPNTITNDYSIVRTLHVTNDNNIIVITLKNYCKGSGSGSDYDAAMGIICFDSDGNTVYNKAYQDNPSTAYLVPDYASAIINISGTDYLIVSTKQWGKLANGRLGYTVLNASNGNIVSINQSNLLPSGNSIYGILPINDNSYNFWYITQLGDVVKTAWNSNTSSVAKKYNIAGIANVYSTVKTDNNKNIHFLVATSSTRYQYFIFNSDGVAISTKYIDNIFYPGLHPCGEYLFFTFSDGTYNYITAIDSQANYIFSKRTVPHSLRPIIHDNKISFIINNSGIFRIITYNLDWFIKTRYYHFSNHTIKFRKCRNNHKFISNTITNSTTSVTWTDSSYLTATPYTISSVDVDTIPSSIEYGKKIYI